MLLTSASFVAALVAIDFVLNAAFAMPEDPRVEPTMLQQYFDYGRSTEGKLRRLVAATDERAAPIAKKGWIREWSELKSRPDEEGGLLIAAYGQSFTKHLSRALDEKEGVTMRFVGGPSSPPGHSFACYMSDRKEHEAQVVLIGILASAFPYTDSLSGMCWTFESPFAYTYPLYRENGGHIEEVKPLLGSLDELRAALGDEKAWGAWVEQLEREDGFYDPVVFREDVFDGSSLGRLVRRAIGQKRKDYRLARYRNGTGAFIDRELIDVTGRLMVEFSRTARADGRVPVVVLFHNLRSGDYLYRALGPRLEKEGVPLVSTHSFVDNTDPDSYQEDGHFSPRANAAIADKVMEVVRKELAGR